MGFVAKRSIDLPLSELMDLEFHLMDTRPGVKLEAFIADLLERWLTIEKERLAVLRNGSGLRGYQWKNVFLPEGTNLRTSYHHTTEFSKVIGDRILSDDGSSLTPSLFANRHAKGRNAWRFIWFRFPGEEYWVRAADCRADSDKLLQRRTGRILQFDPE
ncbi:hypothetical protein SAMN05216319_3448 [Duganella sp. CF402]|uniref:hypothetical protein n=1 Tax=unclassified Duganella TaxID=2636909 RepID=UPI0008B332CE|nr:MULTISPECIES: hypothetical protein [unclassified Duganella]RZT08142.1 hypothetical protein EV582_0169 [Duganella sp. BK701]SEM04147.1 hypothetical protein SAMN05216319_3448 [Duganella sp. CF402]